MLWQRLIKRSIVQGWWKFSPCLKLRPVEGLIVLIASNVGEALRWRPPPIARAHATDSSLGPQSGGSARLALPSSPTAEREAFAPPNSGNDTPLQCCSQKHAHGLPWHKVAHCSPLVALPSGLPAGGAALRSPEAPQNHLLACPRSCQSPSCGGGWGPTAIYAQQWQGTLQGICLQALQALLFLGKPSGSGSSYQLGEELSMASASGLGRSRQADAPSVHGQVVPDELTPLKRLNYVNIESKQQECTLPNVEHS